jgi:hypothetical protein
MEILKWINSHSDHGGSHNSTSGCVSLIWRAVPSIASTLSSQQLEHSLLRDSAGCPFGRVDGAELRGVKRCRMELVEGSNEATAVASSSASPPPLPVPLSKQPRHIFTPPRHYMRLQMSAGQTIAAHSRHSVSRSSQRRWLCCLSASQRVHSRSVGAERGRLSVRPGGRRQVAVWHRWSRRVRHRPAGVLAWYEEVAAVQTMRQRQRADCC